MNVVVCVRQLANGEINPFDACSYEAALSLKNAEITLLSMGPMSVKDFLLNLTRLGAKRAILLSSNKFAGADTLATAYTLSLALKKLSPDLILCGRQSIDGDTGQVGPELSVMLDMNLITNVMNLYYNGDKLCYQTREGESGDITIPSLLTLEKINTLRLPSIRSKMGEVEVWDIGDINADETRCGLTGSPTRVVATFKNEQDRRKCKFISKEELSDVIKTALNTPRIKTPVNESKSKLKNVWIIGESPYKMAQTISDDITSVPLDSAEKLAEKIKNEKPEIVLWGSEPLSKTTAAKVAAILKTGLCADCTLLETDGKEFFMYRPAFSGDIIAKIKCLTRPQMASVRTLGKKKHKVTVGLGYGVKDNIEKAKSFAENLNADIVASRKLVDNDYIPYEQQVGLTGKSINSDVYIALGISGAIHHISGIKHSGTIIAINNDKNADIFKYADYGIVESFENI